MTDARDRLRLALQSLRGPAVGDVAHVHELDRDPALQLGIERGMDHAHAPAADPLGEHVPVDA